MALPNVSYEQMYNTPGFGVDGMKHMLSSFERKLNDLTVALNYNVNHGNEVVIQRLKKEVAEHESTVNNLKTFILNKQKQQC